MKKLLLFVCCCIALSSFAQDTLKKTNKVGDFNEEFTVLKSNKKMRQGSYKLLYQKAVVAEGKYDQGKRAGVWNFYADNKQVQQFDYTANKVVSSTPDDNITYNVDANSGDDVKSPVFVGGLAGLRLLASYTNYAENIPEGGGRMTINHSINIDGDGKITNWTTIINGAGGFKAVNPSFTDIPLDVALFIPATVNGKKVPSLVSFKDKEKVADSAAAPAISISNHKKTKSSIAGGPQ
jgi:hypothetical protein